ncbi:hypothetical protein [Secundilactobacillus yichangensis]|uniref:hypothetical protein n=1 Tax=Secundilactobacillus yichangensis TaxID=2799580 RepID=UPI0019453EE4|nr:hypothetical protein [Secundilactobacillus yichangensis]
MKKQAAILGLTLAIGATAIAVKPSEASAKRIHSVSTTKVMQYKSVKKAQYTVTKSSKGYLYKQATLKTKVNSIKKYSKVKFSVSKEAVVRKSNGKKAVYYYAKSSKVSGWLWHGYLIKVSVRKPAENLNMVLQQQIASLQQQISDLKNQKSSSENSAKTTNSTDDSAKIASLQNQINLLKNSENTSQSTNTGKSNDDITPNADHADTDNIDKVVSTDDAFNGIPTEYYIESYSSVYMYPDSKGKQYPTIISGHGAENNTSLKTIQVYAKPNSDEDDEYWGYSAGLLPVEVNGQKGYVGSSDVFKIPVNERFVALGSNPNNAGFGNVAPTEVKFIHPLADGAIWKQYTKSESGTDNTLYWYYQTATKTWTSHYFGN